MDNKEEYEFIDKIIFFPKYGIVAVGDLHLGFDYKVQQSGILIPEMQVKEVINELKGIFFTIKSRKYMIKKVILMGDIKHSFSYEWREKNYFKDVLDFLKKEFSDKNVIMIKGNHDTIDYSFKGRLKNYYICKDLAFTHGHKIFPKIFEEKIKIIVIGHLHPSVILSDKQNIKTEKYKCFLVGKFRNKKVIIMPSFLATVEGQSVNEIRDNYENKFSIIPKKTLMNFSVFVIGKDKVYEFGRVRDF